MANIFPAAGNVGIGTTSPQAPLHVQTGSALLALFQSYSPNTANSYIQLESSNASYSWQISDQDAAAGNTANGLAFLEVTAPAAPVARVYFQQGGNVGIGVTSNGARFAVASALTPSQNMVQFQGQAITPAGMRALALGYGDSYDSVALGEVGYIQAEHQGAGFVKALLHLNPMGGAVAVGTLETQFAPPDVDQNQNQYSSSGVATPRFSVLQYVATKAPYTGSAVTGGFEMHTIGSSPASVIGGRLTCLMSGGVAGGNGSGPVRAVQARTIRSLGAGHPWEPTTWGMEIGLHSLSGGNQLNQNVGIYIESSHVSPNGPAWLASGVRNDAALYITGEDGWHQALKYVGPSGTQQFLITQPGGFQVAGPSGIGTGSLIVDVNGNLTTDGTIASANAVSGTALFRVDSGGNVFAASYSPPISSREFKTDVARISEDEALSALRAIEPVCLTAAAGPAAQSFGFRIDNSCPLLGSGDAGALELLAVLTRAYKEQRAYLRGLSDQNRQLRDEIATLEHPGTER